jgi:hypothetical protein
VRPLSERVRSHEVERKSERAYRSNVPVLNVVEGAGRGLVRRDVAKRKHLSLALALELLDLLNVINLDRRVLLQLETGGFEEGGGRLDTGAEDDEVGGERGTVLENDGADLGRVGGGRGEVGELDGEEEFGALRLVELREAECQQCH